MFTLSTDKKWAKKMAHKSKGGGYSYKDLPRTNLRTKYDQTPTNPVSK